MKKIYKNMISIVLVSAMVFTAGGCTQNTSDSNASQGSSYGQQVIISEDSDYRAVQKKEKLYVGVSENPPFVHYDGKNVEGIDVDLALMYAKSWLGVDVKYVSVKEDEVTDALYKGAIDCYWNSVGYNSDLDKLYSCSNPYLKNAQVIVVKDDDDAYNYQTLDDLKDKTFAVCKDSAAEAVAKSNGLNYVTADTEAEALFYISAAKAQAVIVSCFTVNDLVGRGTDYEDLVSTDIILNNEEMVVLFRKGSGLCEQFNTYLLENREDFVERVVNYGGMQIMVPEAEE